MATAAQIFANRANAQKSTGPRTVEGKTASSLNALKHGADAASVIIPGEDPAEYDRIVTEYHRDLQPQSALEELQVNIIIHSDWQRRRLQRIETNLYRQLLSEGATPTETQTRAASRRGTRSRSCSAPRGRSHIRQNSREASSAMERSQIPRQIQPHRSRR
jgi:hypothetical protein